MLKSDCLRSVRANKSVGSAEEFKEVRVASFRAWNQDIILLFFSERSDLRREVHHHRGVFEDSVKPTDEDLFDVSIVVLDEFSEPIVERFLAEPLFGQSVRQTRWNDSDCQH